MKTARMFDGQEWEVREIAILGERNEVTFGHALDPETGDPWAVIIYEDTGIVFTTTPLAAVQPETVAEIDAETWYSRGGTEAIMFPTDLPDCPRLPVLPPWALE